MTSTPATIVGVRRCAVCGAVGLAAWPSDIHVEHVACAVCGQYAAAQDGPGLVLTRTSPLHVEHICGRALERLRTGRLRN